MLEDEKTRLKRAFADKKDLMEKKLRFENEEKLRVMTDQMKQEFGHNQRISDNRHHEQIIMKEKDLSLKLEEMQRRMEQEAMARE